MDTQQNSSFPSKRFLFLEKDSTLNILSSYFFKIPLHVVLEDKEGRLGQIKVHSAHTLSCLCQWAAAGKNVRIIPAWGDAFPDATSQQTVVYGLPESESLSMLLITLNRHFFINLSNCF